MLTKPSCEQRTSPGLPSRAALSPEGYHVLSSVRGSNVGQSFLTLWSWICNNKEQETDKREPSFLLP